MHQAEKILLALTIAIIIVSCTSKSNKEKDVLNQIEKAWVLSDDNIDSAITLSDSLRNAVYTSSEYARMKFDLLNIRIRYKSDMLASSIDSIKKVSNYMEEHGTETDRMRAYYYMGCIYADLHDSPKAVEYTLKALSYIEDPLSCDTSTALKSYSLLSNTYRIQHNFQEATETALSGLRLAAQAKMVDCWYIMDVATSYLLAGDKKKGMEYCRKAYEKLKEENSYKKSMSVASEMMYLFAREKDYGKVDTLASQLEAIPGHERSYNYNFAKAIVYEAKGKTDSAIIYHKKDLSISSLRERQPSLSHLFYIYYNQGNYKEAAECAFQYQKERISINEKDQQEWTRNSKGMYDYQRDKELEETLARENELMRFWGIIGFCVLLIIIAGLAALHFYKEKRTMEKTLGKDKKLAEMQSELQKKMEKVAQMEQALKELEAHSCELEAALTKKRAQLNDMTRASSLSSARVALADTMNTLEDYVRQGKSVPADCWKQICSAVDSEYPSFRAEIMEQIPRMKDHMLCTCYLVKLGMKNQQIEILTGCPHQTVWNRVNKIKEALNRMDSASA